MPNRTIFIFALLLCFLLLTACNLGPSVSPDEPNIIYVTVTPAPVTPATPAPPTAIPTPTVVPDVALQQAGRDFLNGHFESAVFLYQVVLAQGESVPQDMRAAAAFGMGQAALREGLFSEAVSSLTLLINQFPQDERLAWAYFIRGDAYLGLLRWPEAIADFQQYLALHPGLIDSYIYERIGDAQLALGQFDAALNSYAQATEANRSLVPLLVLREKVAQIHETAGQIEQAIAQYDAILTVARNTSYRASIEFDAAQTLINSGDLENGLVRMQRIFNEYSSTPSAYHAMNILLQNGRQIDDLERGRVAFDFDDYTTTIDALNSYTTQHQLAAIPASLHLMLGRAYREIGNSAAALVAFRTIIEQYPQDSLFGVALLEQGRTYFLSGDIPSAIIHYLSIADSYGYLPEAAEALWRAGYLYGTNGDTAASREIFLRLADDYPGTEQANSGLFIAASGAYNEGLTAIAENLFARLSVTTTGDDQAAAYLWVGRLALQHGDDGTADSAFNLAVQAAPDSYFAARAGDIRSGIQPFQLPTSYQFQFDESAQLSEAENWLRQTFGLTQEGALWMLPPELESDPRIVRGRELWMVSAYDEAEAEFDGIIDESRETGDALTSYRLAIYLRSIGMYLPSIVAAADVIKAANVSTLEAPAYIARMRYPIYYLDIVLEASQRHNVAPLLMFSLIRHESLFNTNATAAAGEKGLTQVIPATGEYIAGQLEWPDYQHSDLFRPYAGVEFGAYYFGEQLQRFDNNVPAALAGYNAGPGRASDWLLLAGNDPDLFMATITIDSTRHYVQRIYGFYNIYRTLYGAG